MKDRLHLGVDIEDACTGKSQQCPPPTVKIEKVDGNLRLCGVSIGNTCKVSLPAFGFLFIFIGVILTTVAFKAPDDRIVTERRVREDSSSNIKVLGPVCIVVGIVMVVCAILLKYFTTRSVDEHTRVGFYCPVHGDFYPLSPAINPRRYSSSDLTQDHKWWLPSSCVKKNENVDTIIPDIPTCPHSISPSNRSSFDGQHVQISNPYPNTFFITTTSVANKDGTENNEPYQPPPPSSSRSLSVPNDDVVSFPSYRSRSNPPTSPATPTPITLFPAKRASCPTLPEIGTLSQLQIEKLSTLSPWAMPVRPILHVVRPTDSIECLSHHTSSSSINSNEETKKRKSVSILLPPS